MLHEANISLDGIDKIKFMMFWRKVYDDNEACDYEELMEAFKQYDVNGDGFITSDEIRDVISKATYVNDKEAEVKKCIEDMDANRDGKISYAEFLVKLRL